MSQFYVYLLWGLNSVLNVKALVGAFNQKEALVGAFSVIVKTNCETDGSFTALVRGEASIICVSYVYLRHGAIILATC